MPFLQKNVCRNSKYLKKNVSLHCNYVLKNVLISMERIVFE